MDPKERFYELLESNQKDPEIQYQLGLCLLHGDGVAQDGIEGEKWLHRAARQGHPEARAMLEDLHQEGAEPLPITEENLVDWCAAAEDGDAEAQYQVACYFLEEEIEEGRKDAMRYLSAAADQGHPQACVKLGEQMLMNEAPELAVKYFHDAADCGLPEAMDALGQFYSQGIGVEQDLEEAERWFIACAENGDGEWKLELAWRYRTGDGVPQSPARALSWLQKAELAGVTDARERFQAGIRAEEEELQEKIGRAEAGDRDCQRELGEFYFIRQEPQDAEKSAYWFEQAARQGDAQAQYNTGINYQKGEGVPQDAEKAAYWYEQAARQDLAEAQLDLGLCYFNGCGVPQDAEKAVYWCEQAARQGLAVAQANMGLAYAQGVGVLPDMERSAYWYGQAAQ